MHGPETIDGAMRSERRSRGAYARSDPENDPRRRLSVRGETPISPNWIGPSDVWIARPVLVGDVIDVQIR